STSLKSSGFGVSGSRPPFWTSICTTVNEPAGPPPRLAGVRSWLRWAARTATLVAPRTSGWPAVVRAPVLVGPVAAGGAAVTAGRPATEREPTRNGGVE